MNKFLKVLVLLLNIQPLVAQNFNNYYRSPVDFVILSSGNFAETRPNHFHSGVDVKTGGVEGKPLYAAASGYISRVNIAPRGFGHTIYIAHPNGTTTVYAHMKSFMPAVAAHVRNEQYRLQKHAIDLYFGPEKFPVSQGEQIGLSGNSGSSGGPHLHYEVRDAAQRPMNPIKIGAIKTTDNLPPTIVRLHYVAIDSAGIVPIALKPCAIEVVRGVGSNYTIKDTLEIAPNGYFVIEATDRKNGTQNTMGIYRAALSIDGKPHFEFALDKFAFSETRYVNSLCYYPLQRGARNQFLRLARQAGNKLPIYKGTNGAIRLPGDVPHTMEILLEDDSENTAILKFVTRSVDTGGMPVPEGVAVDHTRAFTTRIDGMGVTIPAGALYDNILLSVSRVPATLAGRHFSPAYSIGSPDVPLHRAMTVALRADTMPAALRPKACLGLVTADGKGFTYAGGKLENGWVVGSSSVFGRFVVAADDVAPTIVPSFAEGADLTSRTSVAFTIGDNFSGVASFEGNIDGQWIIFEQQGRTITHHFDPAKITYNGGQHTLRLTVRDAKGNAATISRGFKR